MVAMETQVATQAAVSEVVVAGGPRGGRGEAAARQRGEATSRRGRNGGTRRFHAHAGSTHRRCPPRCWPPYAQYLRIDSVANSGPISGCTTGLGCRTCPRGRSLQRRCSGSRARSRRRGPPYRRCGRGGEHAVQERHRRWRWRAPSRQGEGRRFWVSNHYRWIAFGNSPRCLWKLATIPLETQSNGAAVPPKLPSVKSAHPARRSSGCHTSKGTKKCRSVYTPKF